MTRVKSTLLAISFLFSLAGCDSRVLWRDAPYQVYWIDNSPYKLGYDLGNGGVISKVDHVNAVGSDSSYVVVRSHKPGSDQSLYYFIDKAVDSVYRKDSVEGPFSREAYEALKEKKNLPDFEKEF